MTSGMKDLTEEQRKKVVKFINKYAIKGIIISIIPAVSIFVILRIFRYYDMLSQEPMHVDLIIGMIMYLFTGLTNTFHYISRYIEKITLEKNNFHYECVLARDFEPSFNIFRPSRFGSAVYVHAVFYYMDVEYIRTVLEGAFLRRNSYELILFITTSRGGDLKIYAYPRCYFDFLEN